MRVELLIHGGVLDSLGEAVARVARRDSTWSR